MREGKRDEDSTELRKKCLCVSSSCPVPSSHHLRERTKLHWNFIPQRARDSLNGDMVLGWQEEHTGINKRKPPNLFPKRDGWKRFLKPDEKVPWDIKAASYSFL